jgi:hypothetical protein
MPGRIPTETVPLPVPSTKNIMSCICRWKINAVYFYSFIYLIITSVFAFWRRIFSSLSANSSILLIFNIRICEKAWWNAFLAEKFKNNTLFSILLLVPRKIYLPVSLTTAYSQRVFNVLQRTRLSRCRMIWLLPHYLLPLSGSCLSLPVFLCVAVAGRAYWREMGGGGRGNEPNQNHTTARKPGLL